MSKENHSSSHFKGLNEYMEGTLNNVEQMEDVSWALKLFLNTAWKQGFGEISFSYNAW